ncbi:hypothetical protein EDD18DRAFT_1108004 [Armillaria luteobubalina]|uniref:Uncharacterized protein n=1 Tax=Armillaria luteobubalina TaxID=153913 RepID=A0AA39UM14_9AGAR|nr:hypothetical protein EDD18DRAFT_1108004 [Armillaria luteobubalina]
MDRQVVTILPVFPCDESVEVFIPFAPPALAALAAPVASPAVPALPVADAGAVEGPSHFFDILLLLLPIATLSIILPASILSNVRARNFSWLVQFAPVAVAQVNSGTTYAMGDSVPVVMLTSQSVCICHRVKVGQENIRYDVLSRERPDTGIYQKSQAPGIVAVVGAFILRFALTADTDIQKRVQNIQERFKSGTLNGTLKKWTKLQITQEASVSNLLIRNAISIGKVGITSLFLHKITEGVHPEIESTLVIDA